MHMFLVICLVESVDSYTGDMVVSFIFVLHHRINNQLFKINDVVS